MIFQTLLSGAAGGLAGALTTAVLIYIALVFTNW